MSSIGFPLLLIPVAICNIIAFLMPDLSFAGPVPLFSIPLKSRDVWTVTLNDVLVALSILLLWLEVIRAARPAPKYFVDHFLSLLVAAGAAYEFVMLPKFGNSTFFLITLTAIVDFLAGISLRARRPRRVAAPVYAPEPVREAPVAPAPVPPPAPVPAATSVAEAVLADRSTPQTQSRPPASAPARVEPVVVPSRVEPTTEPATAGTLPPEPVRIDPMRVEPRIAPAAGSNSTSDMDGRIEPKVEPVPAEVVAHTSPQIESANLQADAVDAADHTAAGDKASQDKITHDKIADVHPKS